MVAAPSGRPSQRQRLLEARITKLEAEVFEAKMEVRNLTDLVNAMAYSMRRNSDPNEWRKHVPAEAIEAMSARC